VGKLVLGAVLPVIAFVRWGATATFRVQGTRASAGTAPLVR
jgi:hypothetical protein